jgi:hypothetical protein
MCTTIVIHTHTSQIIKMGSLILTHDDIQIIYIVVEKKMRPNTCRHIMFQYSYIVTCGTLI